MKQNRFKSWALWTSIAALVVWCVKEFAGIDISSDMNAFLNVAYRDWETDRKSTRLNSSHRSLSRMPSSA